MARITLPKLHNAPEGHPYVRDVEGGAWRDCESNEDILRGTAQIHREWCGPSKANGQLFFTDMTRDEVGYNGINIKRDVPFTMEDVKDFLPNWEAYSDEVIERFIDAHNGPVRQIFEEEALERDWFYWPFYDDVDTEPLPLEDMIESGDIFSLSGLEEEFWKMVVRQPGKARHDGFQLGVTLRMGTEWATTMYEIIQLALVQRYIPACFRPCTRIPIPKSTPGETRPLMLLHDAFTFMSSAVGERMAKAMAKENVIIPETITFQKGKASDDITQMITAIKEDANENDNMVAIIYEDEEKFYDRVTAQLQGIACKLVGFPDQGYVEFKIDEMRNQQIVVSTRQGTVTISYTVGLFQGSMWSVVMANLVAALKKFKSVGQSMH